MLPIRLSVVYLLSSLLLLSTIILTPSPLDAFKMPSKNTVEMLNNGLKALVSIKRILSTLKSVNELTGQAFPHLAKSPKMKMVNKILSVVGAGSSTGGTGNGKATTLADVVAGTISATKRNPSLGMIKIGEKPPPGLFPETLPYSLSGSSVNGAGGSTSASGDQISTSSTLNPTSFSTSDLFNKLAAAQQAVAAAAASANSGATGDANSQSNTSGGASSGQFLTSSYSPNDLKLTASIIRSNSGRKNSQVQPIFQMLPYEFNRNVYQDPGSFEGTYEVLPN